MSIKIKDPTTGEWIKQSTGGGGGVLSWNDLPAPLPNSHLPEGYPYAEEGLVALIEEQTLTAGSDGMMAVNKAVDLTLGETYKVTWNGSVYNCIAVETDLSAMGFGVLPTLGNLSSVGGTNTGEPFAMAVISANNITGFMPLDGSTTATVKVEGMGEVVHKMDEKYLPAMPSIYTFKGLITTDMVNGWADDDNPNAVCADELFNTILPLVLEGKTLFFLEIVDDYITDRFPCELITVMASPFTAGEYLIEFKFSADRNSGKKAKITIGNITGD